MNAINLMKVCFLSLPWPQRTKVEINAFFMVADN